MFREDIGPELAQDLRRVGGLIFAGLPVPGSDTGDYLVRNLMAIDPGRGWLVLGAEIAAGDPILFCRRDPESARRDMVRMVRQLAGRLSGPPKAGSVCQLRRARCRAVRRARSGDRADRREDWVSFR